MALEGLDENNVDRFHHACGLFSGHAVEMPDIHYSATFGKERLILSQEQDRDRYVGRMLESVVGVD